MTYAFDNGRQTPLVAIAQLALADFTTTVAKAVVKMPVNSVITGGYINVTQVWNSTSSDAADLGHTGDDDKYSATPLDLQSLGVTALDVTGYVNTGGLDLNLTWTSGGGTPSTGAATLVVEYIIVNRATEVQ